MSRKYGKRHAKRGGFVGALWVDRSVGARIAIAVAASLLALILLISVSVHVVTGQPIWTWIETAFFVVENLNQDEDFNNLDPTEDLGIEMRPDSFPEGITNIALFGIDSRSDGMKGLSDSIMVISVDAVNNNIKLVSVMRDSLVKIDGHGYHKINAAYNLGGAKLAVKTLNQVFKLNITNYATVDFVGMSRIIEAVGGIDTVLTSHELENANLQILEMHYSRGTALDYIPAAGAQHLNGIQAVAYSRVRYADVHKDIANGEPGWGDLGRTLRQRYVMSQLFQKALELKLSEYPNFIQSLLPFVQTSLTYSEIYDLAMILFKDGISMQQARIPVDRAVIDYGLEVKGLGQCVYYDLDCAANLMNEFLFKNTSFDDYIALNGLTWRRWLPDSMIVVNTSTDTGSDGTDSSDHVTDTGGVTDTDSGGFGSSGGGNAGSGGGEVTDGSETTDTGGATDTSGTPPDTSGDGSSDTGSATDSATDTATDTGTVTDTGGNASSGSDTKDE